MAVTKLDVTAHPFDNGREFGKTRAYEELTGTAYFAIDPENPLNQVITDLDLAPTEDDGRHLGPHGGGRAALRRRTGRRGFPGRARQHGPAEDPLPSARLATAQPVTPPPEGAYWISALVAPGPVPGVERHG